VKGQLLSQLSQGWVVLVIVLAFIVYCITIAILASAISDGQTTIRYLATRLQKMYCYQKEIEEEETDD